MGLFLLGLIRALTGAQARWQGCPPKAEQRIYFANLQSHADLILMWAALPEELRSIMRPIAAKDYWKSVTGAGGLLDRVDALCFAAPVFFHSVRWYFGL